MITPVGGQVGDCRTKKTTPYILNVHRSRILPSFRNSILPLTISFQSFPTFPFSIINWLLFSFHYDTSDFFLADSLFSFDVSLSLSILPEFRQQTSNVSFSLTSDLCPSIYFLLLTTYFLNWFFTFCQTIPEVRQQTSDVSFYFWLLTSDFWFLKTTAFLTIFLQFCHTNSLNHGTNESPWNKEISFTGQALHLYGCTVIIILSGSIPAPPPQ